MSSGNENTKENKNITASEQLKKAAAEGSLGLLALGAKGIKAWREQRAEEKIKTQEPDHE